jgi:UDP-4-amino-4,6-dideoxy-N-acetyl-beta-L-altrosamine N-acetyltransferase
MALRDEFALRPLVPSDRDLLFRWRNLERVHEAMFTDRPVARPEHDAWFTAALQAPVPPLLVFEHRGRPLGVITVSGIDQVNGRCSWGFYLGETDGPAKSGTVMGYLGLRHLFDVLGIRKVCGECFRRNGPSVRFHEKMGFSREGTFREHHLKNGVYEDVLAFALLRADWPRVRAELEQRCFPDERSL